MGGANPEQADPLEIGGASAAHAEQADTANPQVLRGDESGGTRFCAEIILAHQGGFECFTCQR